MERSAGLRMQIGKWYEVACTVDGTNFTVSTGDVELQHPFEPQFPVFIWLEVQRTGGQLPGPEDIEAVAANPEAPRHNE